jgi:sorbitol-specific phosphotransferase system component IIA
METQISKANPVTNVGRDVPKSTNTELEVSGHLFLNFAANTPRPTPMTIQIISAPIARLIVTGKDSLIMSVTQAF